MRRLWKSGTLDWRQADKGKGGRKSRTYLLDFGVRSSQGAATSSEQRVRRWGEAGGWNESTKEGRDRAVGWAMRSSEKNKVGGGFAGLFRWKKVRKSSPLSCVGVCVRGLMAVTFAFCRCNQATVYDWSSDSAMWSAVTAGGKQAMIPCPSFYALAQTEAVPDIDVGGKYRASQQERAVFCFSRK